MKLLIIVALLVLGSNVYSKTYRCLSCSESYPNVIIDTENDSVFIWSETLKDTFLITKNDYVVEREDEFIELHRKNKPTLYFGRLWIDPLTGHCIVLKCDALVIKE